MSVSMYANEPSHPPLKHGIAGHLPPSGEPVGSSSLRREMAVIREMLWALDTLTIPGQLHDMTKVVGFIEHRGSRLLRDVSPRNRHTFTTLLKHLASECERQLPDTRSFSQGAENLLTLLAAAA